MGTNNGLRSTVLTIVGVLSLPLSGCGNALIYGEGTNFSLTTLRLNDDAATPVRIVSGLDRTVAAVVPRRNHDGDAVNMSALFDLEHKQDSKTFPSVFGDTLKITSEFASGAAAIKSIPNTTISPRNEPSSAVAGTAAGAVLPSDLAKKILNRD